MDWIHQLQQKAASRHQGSPRSHFRSSRMASKVRPRTRELAQHVLLAVHAATDGQPRRRRMLAGIHGATADAVLYAVDQGWIELKGMPHGRGQTADRQGSQLEPTRPSSRAPPAVRVVSFLKSATALSGGIVAGVLRSGAEIHTEFALDTTLTDTNSHSNGAEHIKTIELRAGDHS